MSDQYLAIRLESDHLPGSVKVFGLEGTEAISTPFEFSIRFYCPDGASVNGQDLLGESITVVFERAGVPQRRVHGTVSEVQDFAVTGSGNNAWIIRFVPRTWILSQTYKTDIFLYLTAPEIIGEVLRRQGFEDEKDFEFRLNTRYTRREFTVQYKETDLAFISRLAEHYGICFFFEHDGDRDKIVFADHNNYFKPVPEADVVEWVERDTVTGVQALEVTTRIVPETYHVRDYNYRTPGLKLDAESEIVKTGGGGVVYEHGDHFKTSAEAALFAKVRSEEVRCQRQVFEGRANVPQLLPGATFTIVEHPRGDFALLLTRVAHSYSAATGQEAHADNAAVAYHCEWSALLKSIQFRPARITPRPRVAGLLTAFVEDVSRDNPYAHLDDHGRYRVRFVYDDTPTETGRASHAIRMAQPHVGVGYGMHFPVRQGREVVLSFIDGDPDRPIIVGGVSNPNTVTPSAVQNNVENRLRSGGGNELRMNDTLNHQRLILESPSYNTVIQLGEREHPEYGLYTKTEGHETRVAWLSQNEVTTWSREFNEHKSIYSARSLVMAAGLALPGTQLGQQALKFDQLVETAKNAMVDIQENLAGLDGRKPAALRLQMDDAKVRRDGALDQVAATHPELDEPPPEEEENQDNGTDNADPATSQGEANDSTPAASSSNDDGMSEEPAKGPGGSIGDRIRQTRDAELAALGMANGVVQKAEESLTDYAKRVDSLRRLPLFGKEKHVASALDRVSSLAQKGVNLANKAESAISKAATAVNAVGTGLAKAADVVQGAEHEVQQDVMQLFKRPPRKEGESDAAYRKRCAQAALDAFKKLKMDLAGAEEQIVEEFHSFPDIPREDEEQVKAVAQQLQKHADMDPADREKANQDPPNFEEKNESLKNYERAANQVDRVRNRLAEYWETMQNRPASMFREQAQKLIEELAKKGEGDWGWGDLGTIYTLVTDTMQRGRLGALLEHAEHVATNSGSRLPRESDDILTHPDDTDGAMVVSGQKMGAVVGEDAVVAGERAATLVARGSVNVVGGANAYLHAAVAAEVSAHSSVSLSAHHHVDVQADDNVSIIAHPRGAQRGTDEEEMPHYHTMLIRSRKSALIDSVRGSVHITALEPRPSEETDEDKQKGSVTIDAGHEILQNAKKKIALTSAEDDVIVTTVKQKIRLHALEEAMQLTSKKDMSLVTEAAYTLQGKSIASKSDDDTNIEAGKQVNVKGGTQINLQAGTINIKGKLNLG